MANVAVGREFRKDDLGHQLGPDPSHPARTRRLAGQRTARKGERGEPRVKVGERVRVESRAHLPAIDQPPLLGRCKQERGKGARGAGGGFGSDDDEFGVVAAFHLQPGRTAPAAMARIAALGDQPLAPGGTEPLQHRSAIAFDLGT